MPHTAQRMDAPAIVDFLIAGGGAAGLTLAHRLAASSLRGRSIMIVDRDSKERNDRTWCFWADRPTPIDHLVYRSWDRIEFIGEGFQKVYDARPYQYRMLRGIDFYNGMRESLTAAPGITFLKARISEVIDTKDRSGAQVMIDGVPYGAKWVFDSLFRAADYYQGPKGYHFLKQHFKGWEIETPVDTFDPTTMTMFDFRTPQNGSMRFFYILPFSRRRALVEYTLFSADLLKPHEYDRALADYIERVRGIAKYRITETESGVIPMTDRPFARKTGEHIIAVGTKGGLVKPSSGYAFLRILNDAEAVVQSLTSYGHPYAIPKSHWRYHLFDTIMLQVMYRQGDRMSRIFTELFKNNSIQQIFRFLDEKATFGENIKLLASLPSGPFLKALLRVKLLRKV